MGASGTGDFGDYRSQVLAATDIIELIGRNVALKRRGRDYVGLCPFHQEKSPSFHVKPDRQYFYCFGCKANGSAIDFVMQRDRLAFIDALNLLGEQAGIERPRSGFSKEKAGEKQVLLEAQSAACSLFEKLLSDPQQGAVARDYLKQRGINAESAKRFQIGLAADGWDGLLTSPLLRKFKPEQLAAAGLVKRREKGPALSSSKGDGFYDTFRNRLMFPIRDENSRVIAFGGRVMPGSQDPAKYLNSPETPLFSKSRCVFGIDLARQKIIESRTAVVVEGYTDVVMAHQFGASNVVSILGTAMTEQHVALLRRFADRIVLLFDADTAGDTAVDRAVSLFVTQPVEIAIAQIDTGLDPDEYLLKEGAEAFAKLIATAPDALAYKWKQLARRFEIDGGSLTGQQRAVEQYLELLAQARQSGPVDGIRWGAALARVSRLTDIPVEQLNRRLGTAGAGARRQPERPRPVAALVAAGETEAAPAPADRPPVARDRAERWLLGLLLLNPRQWLSVQRTIAVTDFTDDARRRLAELYWAHQRDLGEPVFNEFLGLLGDATSGGNPVLQQLAVEIVEEVESLQDSDATLAEAVRFIEEDRRRGDQQKLRAQIRRTDGEEMSEQDEVALFRKLQENARQPDMRRV